MPQPTSYTQQFSSNPYELPPVSTWETEEEFFLRILECEDDFWWDEEERHELF